MFRHWLRNRHLITHPPRTELLRWAMSHSRLPSRTKSTANRSLCRCWTLQEWIRALASFNVLGSPVIPGGLSDQQPLWEKRVEALKQVPPLFEAIKQVKTEHGLTWDIATSGRRVLTKEGKVTIATSHGDSYKELETPTKVHGLVGACFSGMWNEPALAKHFPTYSEFNLVATTILTSVQRGGQECWIRLQNVQIRSRETWTSTPPRKCASITARAIKMTGGPVWQRHPRQPRRLPAPSGPNRIRKKIKRSDTVNLLAPRIRRSLQQASGIGIGAGNPGIGKAMDKAR